MLLASEVYEPGNGEVGQELRAEEIGEAGLAAINNVLRYWMPGECRPFGALLVENLSRYLGKILIVQCQSDTVRYLSMPEPFFVPTARVMLPTSSSGLSLTLIADPSVPFAKSSPDGACSPLSLPYVCLLNF